MCINAVNKINLPRDTSRIRGMIHQKKKMPAPLGSQLQNNNMIEPQKLLQAQSKVRQTNTLDEATGLQ